MSSTKNPKLRFKNFCVTESHISAEIFCDGEYVMEISSSFFDIKNCTIQGIALYDCFTLAVKKFLAKNPKLSISYEKPQDVQKLEIKRLSPISNNVH